jgi:hypothetical protein
MKRFLWLGFVASVYLICTGCGDTFRPIIIPNPPTFPNPRAAHSVVTISQNFEWCPDPACINGTALIPGSAMVIDVSGDSDVSVVDVNLAPIHAAQQSANQVLVVNQAVTGVTPPPSGCLVVSEQPYPAPKLGSELCSRCSAGYDRVRELAQLCARSCS